MKKPANKLKVNAKEATIIRINFCIDELKKMWIGEDLSVDRALLFPAVLVHLQKYKKLLKTNKDI